MLLSHLYQVSTSSSGNLPLTPQGDYRYIPTTANSALFIFLSEENKVLNGVLFLCNYFVKREEHEVCGMDIFGTMKVNDLIIGIPINVGFRLNWEQYVWNQM